VSPGHGNLDRGGSIANRETTRTIHARTKRCVLIDPSVLSFLASVIPNPIVEFTTKITKCKNKEKNIVDGLFSPHPL
jgi:hypothetical protein